MKHVVLSDFTSLVAALGLLLSFAIVPAVLGQQFMEGTVVTEESSLNIRSGPGTAYNVIAVADKGERLALLNTSGDWYQVQLSDGRTGYAFQQFIQITSSNLHANQVGVVTPGMSVDALYTHYEREQIQLVDLALEGIFTPALNIYTSLDVRQGPSLTAEIGWNNDWVISRITVYDPQFRTDCGIGVGSTIGALKRCYTLDWAEFGEGPLYVGVKELPFSFALNPADLPKNWGQTNDPYALPDYLSIMSILIH